MNIHPDEDYYSLVKKLDCKLYENISNLSSYVKDRIDSRDKSLQITVALEAAMMELIFKVYIKGTEFSYENPTNIQNS